MSTLPENELDLDKLFLPAWAQEPASKKSYAHYQGGGERPDRRGDRREGRPQRRDDRPRGDRPPPGQQRREGDRPQGDRRKFPGKDRPQQFRRDQRPPLERREPLPLPEINTQFTPEEKGVDSLARQIRMTGRAYPLFDIARLILDRPERHSIVFGVKKNAEGKIIQPLFLCALDDSLWLSEDDAVGHVLRKHFDTFYKAERTATEPPKGTYTFVAQCGMSGVILGPPNYHDYQNQLRKLHAQRFSRIPFDVFKARVKIVRDEAVVKKWVEDQSFKTEFVCLNVPEPLRLPSREAVEKHFREVHKESIIKEVESHTLTGPATRNLRSPDLARLVRTAWEAQRRFPLQIATTLSQQFARQGLQFFKKDKTVTHVSVARPNYLDLETTPVSETIKRIVEFINATPKCTRRKLFEALAPLPTPAAPIAPVAPEVPPTAPDGTTSEAPATPAASAPSEPTVEQTAVNADLHWLIHQGHVIEFANGILETAKKPAPKPPKPAKLEAGKPAEVAPTAAEPVASTDVVTAEQIASAQITEEVSSLPEPAAPIETVSAEPATTEPTGETKSEEPQAS
jgi:hypothetical protein